MMGGPSIKHLDDVPAEEMLRFEFADRHSNFILRGEIRCGDIVCRAGSHIMLEWGDVFGPWEAGPEGCELYGFIAGEGSPFAGDPEPFEALLAARGAPTVPLPLPTRPPPWRSTTYAQGAVTDWTA